VVKQETEVIDVDSDMEDIAAPAPPPSETQHNIPMIFLLPQTDTFEDIAHLPTNVRAELQHRFHAMCTASEKRKERYRAMQNRPQNRLNRDECIRCQLTKTGKNRRADGYYTQGGEVKKSADDMCIERSSPCVHVVRHNGVCSWCIVPLPAGLRVGKKWDELEYWVTSGEFTT
jgi:hypothetical protein